MEDRYGESRVKTGKYSMGVDEAEGKDGTTYDTGTTSAGKSRTNPPPRQVAKTLQLARFTKERSLTHRQAAVSWD